MGPKKKRRTLGFGDYLLIVESLGGIDRGGRGVGETMMSENCVMGLDKGREGKGVGDLCVENRVC